MIQWINASEEKARVAKDILIQLPDWFGLEDSTAQYIKDVQHMPFLAYEWEGKHVGFLALKETSPHTLELYVMAVSMGIHHQGIGTVLFHECKRYAMQQGYAFLQVKTVQKGHYEFYDRTNRFYESLGFVELECFPTLWDSWNPCQIYIMALS